MVTWSLPRFVREYRKYLGPRVITCPETNDGAAVSVNALHAARSGQLRLSACTRWPERAHCDQACLAQIAAAPADCLVRSIVTSWYAGKVCVCCGRSIGEIVWHEAPPALLAADGTSCEWKDVAAKDLPRVLRGSKPLCWYCNNIAELERAHPKLTIRRQRPPEPPAQPLQGTGVY